MNMQVYVANLGKYTEGYLVGEWIQLPASHEELQALFVRIGIAHIDENGVQHPYKEENGIWYEEYAIHDYELPFKVGEYSNLFQINEKCELFASLSDDDFETVKAIYGELGDWEQAIECYNDGDYITYHDCSDMSDVAYEYYEQTGMMSEIPSHLQSYIDWNAVGRDMDIEGTFIGTDNGYIQLLR